MSTRKKFKQIWDTIRNMNESIESHNRTLEAILETLRGVDSLLKVLTSQQTSQKT